MRVYGMFRGCFIRLVIWVGIVFPWSPYLYFQGWDKQEKMCGMGWVNDKESVMVFFQWLNVDTIHQGNVVPVTTGTTYCDNPMFY